MRQLNVPFTDPAAAQADGRPNAIGHQGARVAALEAEVAGLRGQLEEACQTERVLQHELQHRVRNMLATIRSVFRQSREGGASSESFAEHFQGRLDAIARYYTGTLADLSTSVELEDVVREELLKVHCVEGEHCSIDGGPAPLQGRTLELLGLAVHELTTNAVKFGALAHDGHLAVSWSRGVAADGTTCLLLRWAETGVPLVSTAPRPSGFGRELIEEVLPYEVGASTDIEWKPGGLIVSLSIPMPDFRDPSPVRSADDLFVAAEEG